MSGAREGARGECWKAWRLLLLVDAQAPPAKPPAVTCARGSGLWSRRLGGLLGAYFRVCAPIVRLSLAL